MFVLQIQFKNNSQKFNIRHMKKILAVLLIAMTFTANSQTKKIIYLYNKLPITEAEFKSLDERKSYTKVMENDTAIIKSSYPHKVIGKLDSLQHVQINTYLEKMIGKDFDKNKMTMIHLYSQNDERIKKDSRLDRQWKYVRKHSKELQAFLIGTKDSQIEKKPKHHIYLDTNNVFKNFFFKDSNFSINHVFINPNGDIYIYYGLDDIVNVLDWST